MSAKPVVLRDRARRDIEEAIDHYLTVAAERVALGFIAAVERAFRAIGRYPAAGSPRYAYELSLPGLHSHLLKRYPYLVFYVERDDHVDLWRVLHAKRDIPAWLQDPESA